MRKTINKEYIEGYIQEHNLEIKKVENTESANYGKEYIRGTIDILTSEDGMNVVTNNFTYVSPTWKSGKPNDTFATLKKIIDNGKTVASDGKENATKVRIDTSLGVNDFYTNKDGEETLVSAKQNDGGFVHFVTGSMKPEAERSTFELDMFINKTKLVEANEERHIDEDYLEISGYVFNFRGDLLPVTLVCHNPGGIQYFESLEVSEKSPVFTKVWGKITSTNVVTQATEESAWGEPVVKNYTRKRKEWVVVGTAKEPYELGDAETGITGDELKEKMANRTTYLADVKARNDEYKASKATAPAAGVSATAGGFNF